MFNRKSPQSSSGSSGTGGQASSPLIRSSASVAGPANIRQPSTPATVVEPPSHTPSPAVPHFTGALTANLTTFFNPNTTVGRLIARGEATIQARNQNRRPGDPSGEAGPFNSQPAEPSWSLDAFSCSPSGGRSNSNPSNSNPSYGVNITQRPPAVQRGARTFLRSSRNRIRIEDSPRVSLGPSPLARSESADQVLAPGSPIVLQDPTFSPRASRVAGGLRGAHGKITRSLPMAHGNSTPKGSRRNNAVPAVSQASTTQVLPPPPPRANNTSQQQPNPPAAAGLWNQATPPFRPSRAAISNIYPTLDPSSPRFLPSAAVPPLFANRHPEPIAPLRLPTVPGQPPASPWQPSPWQPEESYPVPPPTRLARPTRSEASSPDDLEHQLEQLEQQQREQLEVIQQRAWDLEGWQRQQDIAFAQHQPPDDEQRELWRQQSEERLRQWGEHPGSSSGLAPATQRLTPGGGNFYHERNGAIVRPAPMVDPFVGQDGGAGSGMLQPATWTICYPPTLWTQGGRHGENQEKRRKRAAKDSPTPGAYAEASGEERMLGERRGEASSVEPESVSDTPKAEKKQVLKKQVKKKKDAEEDKE